jgi:hypothetical protein
MNPAKVISKLLQRLREVNLKLNKDKMELCKPNVKFYGHILTNQGIKADVSKITAIVEMPTPTAMSLLYNVSWE